MKVKVPACSHSKSTSSPPSILPADLAIDPFRPVSPAGPASITRDGGAEPRLSALVSSPPYATSHPLRRSEHLRGTKGQWSSYPSSTSVLLVLDSHDTIVRTCVGVRQRACGSVRAQQDRVRITSALLRLLMVYKPSGGADGRGILARIRTHRHCST
ncbi:hypothetical protein EDB87DRAFT_1296457 [Lactarius vividus]|nr:hypothetical protein EDB87DRAFT_1296457 [Lactarius vividus]